LRSFKLEVGNWPNFK